MRSLFLALSWSGLTLSLLSYSAPQHYRRVFTWHAETQGTRCLRIEVLSDDLIHVELYERRHLEHEKTCLPQDYMIWASPMVDAAPADKQRRYFDVKENDPYRVVYGARYQGASQFWSYESGDDAGVETKDVRVFVTSDARCIRVRDKNQAKDLATICGEDLNKDDKFLRISKNEMFNFYGLGNLFRVNSEGDDEEAKGGDWNNARWDIPKKNGRLGNMRGPRMGGGPDWLGGDPSTSQFPMVYALGPGFLNYGLLFDQPYRMTMTFDEADRYSYETWGDEIRFFVMTGPNLRDLRSDLMRLTGRAPLFPKSQLGHWTSRFGFKNWRQAEQEIISLRQSGFPLEGAAFDLEWFDGKFGDPNSFRFGTLQFGSDFNRESDTQDPKREIQRLYQKYGVHVMPIEESYIDERLNEGTSGEYTALASSQYRANTAPFKGITTDDGCFLARVNRDFDPNNNGWNPARVWQHHEKQTMPFHEPPNWWGKGAILDSSNFFGRLFWHQLKRLPLSLIGILNHWLDLGEPEMYFEYAYYYGFPELYREALEWDQREGRPVLIKHTVQQHGDIHNLYNLFWAMGISEGYERNANNLKDTLKNLYGLNYNYGPRHWTMSRAGTIGSQRYGGMWSGDSGSTFANFNGQLNSQFNMALLPAGNAYSADAGGFFHYREGHDPFHPYEVSINRQWFATASLLDVPLRPHGWAEDGWAEAKGVSISYAANSRGDPASNRANVWRRYELVPYLYSLAHRAFRTGEAMFPPLVYYFQDDVNTRNLGAERMIGPSLLMRAVTRISDGRSGAKVSTYLPKGTWIDYESLDWHDSSGGWLQDVSTYRKERVPYWDQGLDRVYAGLVEQEKRRSEVQKTGEWLYQKHWSKNQPWEVTKPAGYFLNPLFAAEGAIIPKMYVDENTMNVYGKRWGEEDRHELAVRVFSSERESDFDLFEDDGVSLGYQHGEVRTTRIAQVRSRNKATVTINPSQGNFVGAVDSQKNLVEVVFRSGTVKKDGGVLVNGEPQKRCSFAGTDPNSSAYYEAVKKFDHSMQTCWYQANPRLVRVRTGLMSVTQPKKVEVYFESVRRT